MADRDFGSQARTCSDGVFDKSSGLFMGAALNSETVICAAAGSKFRR